MSKRSNLNSKSNSQEIKALLSKFREQEVNQTQDRGLNFNIKKIIRSRAKMMDQLIQQLWQIFELNEVASIVATGGYGRNELFPYSDIDLFVLTDDDFSNKKSENKAIQKFIQLLWDIHLRVGINISTIGECYDLASKDIMVLTSLIESRFLCGKKKLYTRFKAKFAKGVIRKRDFYRLKIEEFNIRRDKYEDMFYALEPNVKEGPGGLRDIQTILWIARFCFNKTKFTDLLNAGFLNQKNHKQLIKAQNLLFKLRFLLHCEQNKDDNRLLLETQIKLARKLQFKGVKGRQPVEQFMRLYYQAVQTIERVIKVLLQFFDESYIESQQSSSNIVINSRFFYINGAVEMKHSNIFKQYPYAIFEIFQIMQKNDEWRKIGAKTLLQLLASIELIDDHFRNDKKIKSLFIDILKSPQGVNWVLLTMYRIGILGQYIQAFQKIEGLMQFDLFHIYTVDAHTLMVIRNLRRFFIAEHYHEFPLAHSIAKKIAKPELLILSGLMHDIAKGSNQDHSILGAETAENFCHLHQLNKKDTKLVKWLVLNHLEMSITAQKKDINNPEVIEQFCSSANNTEYIDYLYLLTVADINSTNPSLYNNYKDSLLELIYTSSKKWFYEKNTITIKKQSNKIQLTHLLKKTFPATTIQNYLSIWDDEYFKQQSLRSLYKQAEFIITNNKEIAIQMNINKQYHNLELLIWCARGQFQFANITCCLDKFDYSVNQAQVRRSLNNKVLYLFFIESIYNIDFSIEKHRNVLINSIVKRMSELNNGKQPKLIIKSRQYDRRIMSLRIKTKITFETDYQSSMTSMNLECSDTPGLLAKISKILGHLGILVVGAYISTNGGKAEDVFLLQDAEQKPVDEQQQEIIHAEIIKKIEC